MAAPKRSTATLAAFAMVATIFAGGSLSALSATAPAAAAATEEVATIDDAPESTDNGAAPAEQPSPEAVEATPEAVEETPAGEPTPESTPSAADEPSAEPDEDGSGQVTPMRFAEGGAGLYRGSIDWFEWGVQGDRIPAAGMTRTTTRSFAGGTLATTCTIGAPSGQGLVVQRPGNFSGDGLDDMYNVGGTGANNTLAIGLANYAAGPAVNFSFNCSATLNGTSVPLAGLVMADAEASLAPNGEYVAATIPAGAQWRIIDRYRPAGCTTDASVVRNGQTLRFAGSPAHNCSAYPTGVAFMEGASSATATVNSAAGRSAIALGVALFTDFSDAPASYGAAGSVFSPPFTGAAATTAGLFAQPLSAAGQPATRLGATVTSEQAAQPSAGANTDVDNAISAPGTVNVTPNTRYTLPSVACTGPGYVRSWIDWNGNGQFDSTEASDPVLCAGGAVSLSWTVPADAVTGATFLRLRIGATQADVAAPTGVTTAGEVEDWPMATRVLEPLSCTPGAPGILFQLEPADVYTVDLVTGESQQVGNDVDARNVNAVGYNPIDDYLYGIGRTSAGDVTIKRIAADWTTADLGLPSNWTGFPGIPASWTGTAHIGDFDAQGHLWISNATHWAEIDLSDPSSPTYLQVVAAGALSIPAGLTNPADWGFNVQDGDLYGVSPNLPATTPRQFSLLRFDTDSGTTSVVRALGALQHPNGQYATVGFGAVYSDPDGFLYASDNTTGGIWRIDMASGGAQFFAEGPAAGTNDGARCFNSPIPIDFGDAPNSYGTSLATDGPRHSIPGYDDAAKTAPLMLGRSIDIETDGQPNAASDGDDINGVDDENGVVDQLLGSVGSPTDVSVSATNNTGAAATIAGWIDLDRNGTFDSDELTTVSVPANSGTATYVLTFPAGTVAGETHARFRLFPGDVTTFSPTGPASAGEVEDYYPVMIAPGPIVNCMTDTSIFNTASDGVGGVLPDGARDRNWDTGIGNATGPASVSSWAPAYVVPPVANAWVTSPYGNADWISFNTAGNHSGSIDLYFRYDFTIADVVQLDGFSLPMDFYADNSVYEVWVNGVAQSAFEDSLPQNTADPYFYNGFGAGRQASTALNNGFQHGQNEIVVQIKSGAPFAGFLAQVLPEPLCADFGDAPNSYGTMRDVDGARHGVVEGLTLGAEIDPEADGQPNAAADGDDNTGVADEDAFATRVVLNPGVTTATLTVPVTNTTGAASTLYGWIDSNANGRFEASEFASVAVPAGATSVDLAFAGMPAMVDGATPVIRLRLTSDVLVDNASTAAVDERALGSASNGEVEDHRAQVATLVPISCTDPFVETFGAGPGYGPPLPAGQTTYSYRSSGVVNDGMYGLVSALPGAAGSWWHTGGDHTPDDTDGRLMLINANFTAGIFFQRTFTQLTPGATYDFSSWITNANNANSAILPNVQFRVIDPASGSVLASANTGDISNKTSLVWERFALQFEATHSTVRLEMANNAPGGGGNDLAIDDVAFTPACEFGDAPDSYGTTIATDGAAHIAGGPTLGTERDTEPDGQPTPGADGDDTTGTPDDEDGVAMPVIATQGRAGAVTVSASNDSDVPVTLAAWLDLDGNGAFDPAERVLVTVPANSGSADYQVSFGAVTTAADTYARFRIYGEQVADPSPIGTAGAGEVEDYRVTVLVPATLQVLKVGEDANSDIVPMDGSQWAVFDAPLGGAAVVAPIGAATDPNGDPVTGLFRDTTLTQGAYWLEETRALDGFELLAQRVPFSVAADGAVTLGSGAGANVTLIDLDGVATLRVEDVPTLDLPDAGGTGTAPIYLTGAALLAAAGMIAVAAFVRRRMSSQRVLGK